MRTAPHPLAPSTVGPDTISRKWRLVLWIIGWCLAASATVAPAFALLFFCWLFPMGLAAPFGASDWTSSVATYGTLLVGWGLYAGLSVYGLKQRRRVRYFWAYAILLVLLILNVAGCRYEATHIKIGC